MLNFRIIIKALSLVFLLGLCIQSTFSRNSKKDSSEFHQKNLQSSTSSAPKKDSIIFLMLRISKDSTSKEDLIVLNKIKKPGKLKLSQGSAGLSRLPYLSFVYYKNNMPIDSMRYWYPLRERVQNTKENAQGFKDVERESAEFFIRFQQKEYDKLKVFKIAYAYKSELLTVIL